MQKGYTARLYPSKEQLNILNKAFGATRFVYNYFLAERIRSYKEDGVSLTYNKTANMLTTLKRDKDHLWLLETDSMALQEALRNLDRAYQNFFKKKCSLSEVSFKAWKTVFPHKKSKQWHTHCE